MTLLMASVLACSSAPPPQEDTLSIMVSLPPQVWLVEQIGGDRVSVRALARPGSSPETFLPSDRDISHLMRAQAFLRLGVPFERGPWFEALRTSGPPIFDQRPDHGHDEPHPSAAVHHSPAVHDHDGEDPHIWLTPTNLRQQALRVTEMLCQLDPGACHDYRRRTADLDARLATLDGELRQQLAAYSGRAFLVFHPSWGHFAQSYGLRQLAVEIDGQPPSDAELTGVLRQARQEGLRVVFVQPQVTGRAARVIAQTLGGCTVTLDPLIDNLESGLRSATQALVKSYEAPC